MIAALAPSVRCRTLLCVGLCLLGIVADAAVPSILNHQGRIKVGSVAFEGTGQFKFALVNGAATTTYWSNDGTSTAGAEPTAAVPVTVSKGLYAVILGDTALTNMSAIPTDIFDNGEIFLRIWFDDGVNGSELISPDHRLASAPWAIQAGTAATATTVADGAVGSAQLAADLTLPGTTTGTFAGDGSALTGVTAGPAPGVISAPLSIGGETQQAQANTHYLADSANPTTVSLPATAAIGSVVQVTGSGAGGWTMVSPDLTPAQWTQRDSLRKWESLASSADGVKLVATEFRTELYEPGQIFTSSDSGVTWTAQAGAGARLWGAVVSSADGSKLAAFEKEGQIYTSTDSGVTWTARESSRPWQALASSADGSKLVAVEWGPSSGGGYIYTSTDSGVTWTQRESTRFWSAVASSADGTQLVAGLSDPNSGAGAMYTSTDSGVTWTVQPGAGAHAWSSIASSADGTKLVASENDPNYLTGEIYTSTDSGVTWTVQTGAGNGSWGSVASSADGTRLAAVDQGAMGSTNGGIYLSSDSGASWTVEESGLSWVRLVSSADGLKLVAFGTTSGEEGGNAGYLYTSPSGSATPLEIVSGGQGASATVQYLGAGQWALVAPVLPAASTVPGQLVSPLPIAGTTQVATTNTGYVATSDSETSISLPLDGSVGDIVQITGAGTGGWTAGVFNPDPSVWTPRETVRSWQAVASSSDGSKLIAADSYGFLYTSTDFGVSWTARQTDFERNWTAVASSADGQKLVAVASFDFIFTSTDSGATWTPHETDRNWIGVASSADGNKLVAVDNSGIGNGGFIYTSTDSGLTWTPQDSERSWTSVASSADGVHLVATNGYDTFAGGRLYTSADSGLTWTPRDSDRRWYTVASSTDGSKLVAGVYGTGSGGYLYTSTDFGVTWTERPVLGTWHSVACSADGTKLIAVDLIGSGGGGFIYTSADSGATWTPQDSQRYWYSAASSADGSRLVAVAGGGGGDRIYTSGGSTAVASGAQGSTVTLQRLADGQWAPVQSLIGPGAVGSAQLASDLTLGGTTTGTFAGDLTGNADTATSAMSATNFTGVLAGDVTGTQDATVVEMVGGSTAADVSAAEQLANAATDANTAGTLVRRDASGNFAAGIITGSLNGDATNFTGSLMGDVTGTQGATAIADETVTGKLLTGFASTTGTLGATDTLLTAINKLNGNLELKAPLDSPAFTGVVGGTFSGSGAALTDLNGSQITTGTVADARLSSNVVLLDATQTLTNKTITGSFTGPLTGNATTATTAGSATNFTGSLVGDVTGTQGATVVATVGGVSASNVASGATLANAATDANTADTLVMRDANGDFSAGTISAALAGNASSATTATTATNFTASLAGDVTGTQSATSIAAATVTGKALTGFVSGAGTLTATDSILTAINKLDGNVELKAPLVSPTFTGTVTLPEGTDLVAPLQLQSGDNLTDPVFGAVEFDGTNVFITNNSTTPTRKTLAFTDSTISAAQIANNTITSAMIAGGAVGSTELASGLTLGGTTSGTFSGSGAALTDLNGSQVTTGTVADARLSSNVVLLDATQVLTNKSITGSFTGPLAGNATTATTATDFTGSLAGDVTGTQGATAVATVGGVSAANVASGATLANAATDADTADSLVLRDANGDFSAGTITATLAGNASSATTAASATNFTGTLIGDVTGTQSATSIAATTVTGKALSGFVSGVGTISATDSILSAINKLDGNIDLKAPLDSPAFTGTVTLPEGTDTQTALKFVEGVNLATPEFGALEFDGTNLFLTNNSTTPTRKTIAFADSTITPAQIANGTITSAMIAGGAVGSTELASGLTLGGTTSGTFSGSAAALTDLNGSQVTTGTVADARLSSNVVLLDATQTLTNKSITGSFTGPLLGNASTATTATTAGSATNFTGALVGDVTGTQGTTTVATVGGVSAANVAAGATLANAATDADTADTLVLRDASGDFSAGTITATLAGNASSATTATTAASATNFTGLLSGDVTGTQSATSIAASTITGKALTGFASGAGTISATDSILSAINKLDGNADLKAPLDSPTFTGTLTLPEGTDTQAAVKFVEGVNLTAPEFGALEFDGTNLFLTNNSSSPTRKTIAFSDSTIAPAQIADGTITSAMIAGAAVGSTELASGLTLGGTTSGTFSGSGAGLTALNATQLTTGTLPDGRLSSNVVLLDATQTLTNKAITGSFTGPLSGNATTATTATDFSGTLGGDVTGTQAATVVATVGGLSAANLASGATLANAATDADTAETLVLRDASGNFSAGTITASLAGNASSATTATTATTAGSATNFTGSLAGDVTGTQGATTITATTVTGKALTGFVSGAGTLSATDSILSAINKLDGNVALKAPLASPTFTGTVSGTFSGSGAALTDLNGNQITTGTVADARLSTNVVLLTATQTLTNKTLNSPTLSGTTLFPAGTATVAPLKLQTGVNLTAPAFGAVEFDGTNVFITNNSTTPTRKTIAFTDSTISAAQIANGTITSAMIAGGAVGTGELAFGAVGSTELASNLTLDGTTSGTFSGSGAALTALNATQLTTGTVADARLSSSVVLLDATQTLTNKTITGSFTGPLSGNASTATTAGSATNFSGTLAGNVTGTQGATVVATVGGVTAANVASGANLANAATNANTASALVKRDASGNFSAGTITAALAGNATTATTAGSATNFTGALTGDVTGTQSATSIAATTVTGKALTGFTSGAGTLSATDSLLTAINKLDGNDALKAPLASPTFTGTVTLPVGTDLVAPLQLQSGDNLTDPVFGAVEFDGTNVFITNNSTTPTRKTIAFTDSTITSGQIANNTITSAMIASGAVGSTQLASGLTLGGTTSGTFSGSGAALTALNATQLTTGTVADARLSGNVVLLDATQTLTNKTITGSFTGPLSGNATTATSATTAGSATNFTGTLAGNVTGTQGATVVATVGGVTAANVASGANLANAATNANTASALVKRDASGNFSAGTITATLAGNATSATTAGSATNFTGTLTGDVTGTQSATSIAATTVTGKVLTGFTSGAGTLSATDSILSAINKLDGNDALKAPLASPTFTGTVTLPEGTDLVAPLQLQSGDNLTEPVFGAVEFDGTNLFITNNSTTPTRKTVAFADSTISAAQIANNTITSAMIASGAVTSVKLGADLTLGGTTSGTFSGNLSGNATTATTATDFSGTLVGDVTGTQSATSISAATVTGKLLTGFVAGPGTITASDTILTAINKLSANIANATNTGLSTNTPDTLVLRDGSGNFSAGTITAALAGNATTATTATTAVSATSFTGSLSGDVTGTQSATAISAATVTGKALTGFTSGAGALSATDSILTALNKLDGNDALKAPLASPTFTGTVSGTFSGSGAALTTLNGTQITTGTVADARLSTNVVLLAATQTLTNKTLNSPTLSGTTLFPAGTATVAPLKLQTGVNQTAPAFGAVEFDGTNVFITNNSTTPTRKTVAFTDSTISASQIADGIITSAMIAGGAVGTGELAFGAVGSTELASNLTLDGTTSGTFSGSGAALTALNATQLTTGTVADARLSSSVALLDATQTLTNKTITGSFTGPLSGNASTATTATTAGTATNFSGSLAGNVTGTQGATVVATVGGVTAANVASGANLANAATNANTASALVKRDASGNFSAGTITATLAGNATTATTAGSAANFSGALSGEVTGTQSATSIAAATVTGKALTGFASTTGTVTSSDTILSAFNKLDGNLAQKAGLASPTFTGTVNAAAVTLSDTLTLPIGTATLAPMKLRIGVNLTTPTFGAVEFDGTNVFITNNSTTPTRKTVAFTDSTITSGQIANGTITSAMIASGAVGSTQLASGLTLGGTTSGTFSGSGAALTALNATQLTTGTVADARLSSNVVLLDATQTLTNKTITGSFTGPLSGNASTATTATTAGSATNFTGALAGNVTGTQGATVVATVGGVTAANVASGANLANAATNANTASALVQRDASGDFSAGTITATLAGSATTAGSSTNFTGALAGNVSGTQGATVVNSVGGVTAANVASGANLANAATNSNTASTVVKRDASGDFSAGTITATLAGNAATATSATDFTGTLVGDVTGPQGSTAIDDAVVTGKLLTGFASTPGTITAADTILTAINKLSANSASLPQVLLADILATPSQPVIAWGENHEGQSTVPALANVIAISAGNTQSIALLADGTVEAWGVGPVVPPGLANVTDIASGAIHHLARKDDGSVTAWGDNSYGQTTDQGFTSAIQVAGGEKHSLALLADGTVAAWGDNSFDQTAVPGGLTGVIAIAAGYDHSLALKGDGTVVAWGRSDADQLSIPGGLSNVVAIAAGAYHSVALKSDGTVVAWGWDNAGQSTVPSALTDVVKIAAGFGFTVALKTDGALVAWGETADGQTTVPSTATQIAQIAAGADHALALRTELIPAEVARLDQDNVFTGKVGIQRTAVVNPLEVEGQASKTIAGNWLANSDRRIKSEIQPLTGALEKLDRVRLVDFRYTEDYRAAHPGIADKRYLNVIAQEFAEVFPDHVQSSGEKLPDGSEILQVDTYPLTIYSAAAVQELHRENESLKKQVAEQKAQLQKQEQATQEKLAEQEERIRKLEAVLIQ